MKNLYRISILLFVFLFSCQKSEEVLVVLKDKSKIPSYELWEILHREHKGMLGIKAEQRSSQNYKISGGFSLNHFPFDAIHIEDNMFVLNEETGTLPVNRSEEIANWYGNDINVSFINSELGNNESIEIYVPEVLEIAELNSDEILPFFISPLSSINWNLDENNKFGVHILVNFDPVFNSSYSDYTENKVHYINTEDDGQYIFEPNDFESFPDGSKLVIRILRGNFQEFGIGSNNDDFLLYTYTDVVFFVELQKK